MAQSRSIGMQIPDPRPAVSATLLWTPSEAHSVREEDRNVGDRAHDREEGGEDLGREGPSERHRRPRSPVAGQPLPRSAVAMLVGELDPSLRLLDGLLHQGHRLDAVTALV